VAARSCSIEPLEQRCLLSVSTSRFVAGVDDAVTSPTNAGLILAADLDSRVVNPLHAQIPITGEGISGLTFSQSGQLFGSTSGGPGATSNLIAIDPVTGVELSRAPIVAAGVAISIADLALQPSSNTIYAVRSGDDGAGKAGEIYTIATSGAATLIGSVTMESSTDGGLAFAPDGTLWCTRQNATGGNELLKLDPGTAAIITPTSIAPSISLGAVIGLAVRQDTNQLVGTDSVTGEVVAIDAATGARTVVALQAPLRGVLGDLAFPAANDASLTQIYHENFETDDGSYIADNDGGEFPGLWHYSLGRREDGFFDHTPVHAWYYGKFETAIGAGRYDVYPGAHQGVLISPSIAIPATGTSILSFSYLLATRPELDRDFVDVSVDNGTTITMIRSRQDGTLPQTGHSKWLTSTYDLSAFAGQQIKLRFSFRTGDAPPFDPEGWYVDDVVIANQATPLLGTVSWEKRDATSNALVGGATFQVFKSGETTPLLTVTDDGSNDTDKTAGQFTVNDLPLGDYVVKETQAPNGYNLDPDPDRLVKITSTELNPVIGTQDQNDSGTTDESDFHNAPILGTISWEKRDATSNTLLGGATFQVFKSGETTALLTVTDDGSNDTDKTPGQFTVINLPLGNYVIKETQAPNGYALDPDPDRLVSIAVGESNPVIGVQDNNDAGTTDESDFHNAQILGTISWEKRDATSNALVGGATFQVFKSGETTALLTVTDDGSNDTDKTPGQFTVINLPLGNYVIKETQAPNGYALDPDPDRLVSITAGELNPVIGVQDNNDAGTTDESDFHNAPILGTISWEKRDATSNALVGGATFQVFKSGETTALLTVTDDGSNDTDKTPGQFTVINLPLGDYVVKETQAPNGYNLDPDPDRFVKITGTELNPVIGTQDQNDSGATDESDFHNPRILGTISWEKRDATAQAVLLGGATFAIAPDPVSGSSTPLIVVDNTGQPNYAGADKDPSPGQFRVEQVLWTAYTVTETVAPAGYLLDSDPTRLVTVGQNERNVTIGTQNQNDAGTTDKSDFHDLLLPPDQTVQFITPLSVYRTDGILNPNDNLPLQGNVTIQGVKWQDLNQNGARDTNDLGAKGWLIFIDQNSDGQQQETERFAITRDGGNYTLDFSNLPNGLYGVLESRTTLSDGIFRVQTFPAANPAIGGLHGYQVEVRNGQIVGSTTGFDFGAFDYSPLVRPADAELQHVDLDPALKPKLTSALSPWQTFRVANNSTAAFTITDIQKNLDVSQIAVAAQFVTLRDSNLASLTFPITVNGGETKEFFAFYDPAIRSADGATVLQQYPDWFDDPATPTNESQTRRPHTFVDRAVGVDGDHLLVVTSNPALTFRVNLVGGSTYDSDITFDGNVDRADYRRLLNILGTDSPIRDGDPGFDPTSDMNARLPNGAEKVINTRSWPLKPVNGLPEREISLGDFAPLAVEWKLLGVELSEPSEFGRSRGPFLDLDPDNSAGAKGVDFTVVTTSVQVGSDLLVTDRDAAFGNSALRKLARVEVRITGTPSAGDKLDVTVSGAVHLESAQSSDTVLVLAGDSAAGASVEDFETVLRTVRFRSSTTTPRTVTIQFHATGLPQTGEHTDGFTETTGNFATAAITVLPTSIRFENRDAAGNPVASAGATFSVTPNPVPGGAGTFSVVDNGTNDADPAIGKLTVDNVAFATYAVVQTAPPSGYQTNPGQSRNVVVSAGSPNPSIGAVAQDDPGNGNSSDFHNALAVALANSLAAAPVPNTGDASIRKDVAEASVARQEKIADLVSGELFGGDEEASIASIDAAFADASDLDLDLASLL
jgi:hypothetical protein